MAVTAGRQEFPFWKPHELLWDDDVYLDGAGFNVAALSAVLPVGLRAGVWRLPDGPAHHSFNERSTLAAAQLVFVRDLGPHGALTAVRLNGPLTLYPTTGCTSGGWEEPP